MRLTTLPSIWSMQYIVVCLCALLSGAFSSLIIMTDFSPPAIYTAEMGPKINFKMLNVDGGRRNISSPADVDYDPVEKKVYWTQWSSKWTGDGLIARCDLNGNGYQELVKELDYAIGLAIDIEGRKMYFSHEKMALESANLDGSGRRDVIRELPTSGFHVFFDAMTKRVWWSDATSSVIESSKADGTNRTVHVRGLQHPSDIFVDTAGRTLYWAEWGADRIATADLQGRNSRTLFQYKWVSTETLPYSISVHKNEIYMINRDHSKLQKIPKNIKAGQVVKPRDVGNVEFGWPAGLYIEPDNGAISMRPTSFVMCVFIPALLHLLLKA